MAQLPNVLDVDAIPQDDRSFDLIPDNTVATGVLEKSEMKNTKDGTGKYLSCTFIVTEGQYENRRLFSNFNLVNKNEQAVIIAERELADLMLACGHKTLEDSDDLIGIPFRMKIGIEAGKNGFEAKNKIKRYSAIEEARPAAAASDKAKPAWSRTK